MARATDFAPHAPISPTTGMAPVSPTTGMAPAGARTPPSLPLTLAELEQQLRDDRRAVTPLASQQQRLHEIASILLETDERALEMFADAETLVAYLRALLDKWPRRPRDTPGVPRRRVA